MFRTLTMTVNGSEVTLPIDERESLADTLRVRLGLTSVKKGCEVGECGACTVLVDGAAVDSCMVPSFQMQGADIRTIEGLSETEIGRVLQTCFVEGDAIQCGFCTPGMLMSAYALLLKNPNPTRGEIRSAIAGNLCRCTGYVPIVNAIERAGWQMRKKEGP